MTDTTNEDVGGDVSDRVGAATQSLDRLYEEIASENKLRKVENEKRDKRIRTNQRATRVGIGVGCLAILVGGIGIKEIRDSNAARCHAGNEFRTADKARWDYILALAPPPADAAAQHRIAKLQGYIATADALRHC